MEIKLSERREHCVYLYLYLYKSQYSTAQTKKKDKNKQTRKWGKNNSLLTHFICRVIMILSVPGSVTMHGYRYWYNAIWVRVRVLYVKSHRYGSETRSMGTGTNFCIRLSMSTGMDKGTTSLLSWALYSCNWKTRLQVCPWRKALQNQFLSVTSNTGTPELWCIPNKLVLRKDTDIIHVAMGGGSKKFLDLLRGGFKKF